MNLPSSGTLFQLPMLFFIGLVCWGRYGVGIPLNWSDLIIVMMIWGSGWMMGFSVAMDVTEDPNEAYWEWHREQQEQQRQEAE